MRCIAGNTIVFQQVSVPAHCAHETVQLLQQRCVALSCAPVRALLRAHGSAPVGSGVGTS